MRLCFDLDNTLCTAVENSQYQDAVLKPGILNMLRQIKQEGHTIIICTARGMGRSKGNAGLAVRSIGGLTLQQLDKWGVPYDEIYFGKPSADAYFDDKGHNTDTASKLWEAINHTLEKK